MFEVCSHLLHLKTLGSVPVSNHIVLRPLPVYVANKIFAPTLAEMDGHISLWTEDLKLHAQG